MSVSCSNYLSGKAPGDRGAEWTGPWYREEMERGQQELLVCSLFPVAAFRALKGRGRAAQYANEPSRVKLGPPSM